MTLDDTRRWYSHLMTLGMLFLAAAVFSWGSQYKLSLYNLPAKASAPMAAAKLLSQKERPTSVNVTELAVAAIPIFITALAWWVSILSCVREEHEYSYVRSDVQNTKRIRRPQGQSFFFFRPPPTTSYLN
ncbi:hypothetical protein [Edaphobacter albus]|uniref:hypothetical protein n=1 Tax=Edaphobacter sp. 4G125 TaxID=2763071 RepID=UPI001647E69F|nr:hypothetical protein [Edaphobacter sp. 4G125]QNI35683.1 hypothetical protein H7846_11575 [Edaphobacter sp. 4G125]